MATVKELSNSYQRYFLVLNWKATGLRTEIGPAAYDYIFRLASRFAENPELFDCIRIFVDSYNEAGERIESSLMHYLRDGKLISP